MTIRGLSGGNICGHKKQETAFLSTGPAKGSYDVYVCTLPPMHSRHEKHYDSVHRVHF